jgi:outer membrane protein insertion porin family
MYYGSIEYSIPVLDKFRLAFFYDIGMVFAKPYSFNPDPYKTGVYNSDVGIGIRLNLPIGPLRLDYAIPLSTGQFNDNGGKFQFGVGYTREL